MSSAQLNKKKDRPKASVDTPDVAKFDSYLGETQMEDPMASSPSDEFFNVEEFREQTGGRREGDNPQQELSSGQIPPPQSGGINFMPGSAVRVNQDMANYNTNFSGQSPNNPTNQPGAVKQLSDEMRQIRQELLLAGLRPEKGKGPKQNIMDIIRAEKYKAERSDGSGVKTPKTPSSYFKGQ